MHAGKHDQRPTASALLTTNHSRPVHPPFTLSASDQSNTLIMPITGILCLGTCLRRQGDTGLGRGAQACRLAVVRKSGETPTTESSVAFHEWFRVVSLQTLGQILSHSQLLEVIVCLEHQLSHTGAGQPRGREALLEERGLQLFLSAGGRMTTSRFTPPELMGRVVSGGESSCSRRPLKAGAFVTRMLAHSKVVQL